VVVVVAKMKKSTFEDFVRTNLLPSIVTGDFALLLRPEHRDPAVWTIDDDVVAELYASHEHLLQRWMQRAALFAAHRVLGAGGKVSLDAMRKARITLTTEDLEVAWTTLEMDGAK
jgi:hypothetical protein